MTAEDYLWFMAQRDYRSHCIMGTDYYITNEHLIKSDGQSTGVGDVYGYYVITRQYFDRYRLPVMHTETQSRRQARADWLWKEWMNLLRFAAMEFPSSGLPGTGWWT